ncbi:MAG: hypothetical protein E7667_00260 [Ruminococcaceae bacterium]|nr:hypothetical protein [Oscillospiraceae bacterium]
MKKIIIILAALLVATSLVACNKNETETPTDNTPIQTPTGSISGEEMPNDDNTPSTDRTFTEKNDTVYVMAATGAANLRTDTTYVASSVAVSVKNGVELERIAVESNNAWSKVKYEGKEYFISNNVIAEKALLDGFEETTKTVKIIADSINVRFVPGRTTDSPIGEFLKDAEVEVVAFNPNLGEQGWYKVKLTVSEEQPHEFGYISAHSDYSEAVEKAAE